MIKSELARVVAKEVNFIDVGAAKRAVDLVFDTIADKLRTGEEVSILDFGTFVVSKSKKDNSKTFIQFIPDKQLKKSIKKGRS